MDWARTRAAHQVWRTSFRCWNQQIFGSCSPFPWFLLILGGQAALLLLKHDSCLALLEFARRFNGVKPWKSYPKSWGFRARRVSFDSDFVWESNSACFVCEIVYFFWYPRKRGNVERRFAERNLNLCVLTLHDKKLDNYGVEGYLS